MRNLIFFIALSSCITVKAQSPQTNLSLGTGFMYAISADDAISPYIYKGTKGLLRLEILRQKRYNEHNLQFSYGSIKMKSDNANIPGFPSQFYFLQYALQRQLITDKKTLLWVGPAISTRAFIRETDYTTTGEAMGSFEIRLKAFRPISKSSKAQAAFNIPLVNFLVYRKYGLSGERQEIVGWRTFQSFQIQFAYSVPMSQRVDFVLGYDFLFYNYRFIESVKVVNQQYYSALRINLKKDASKKK